ncbi:MAG TPA: hypothetical protein VJQ54_09300 [Candidatus Sulfotelmatobacter sp.]|nr:hypothetical protein [Candidatus Sulfotelmatobacter sp.]
MLQDLLDDRKGARRAPPPVIADKNLFGAPTPEQRRSRQWLSTQVKKAQTGGPFGCVDKLSPELATVLLEKNELNRNLSELTVLKYVNDICRGMWSLNGEPLIISREGALNDGQHRCHAVIRSGRSIETFFSFGAARETRTTIDQGLAKSPGDYLGMDGIPCGKRVAHAARVIYLYDTFGKIVRNSDLQPTKVQISSFVHSKPEILASSDFVGSRSKGAGTNGLLIGLHCIFSRISRQEADRFIDDLLKGVGLAENDPAYVLRERLMEEKRKRRVFEAVSAELIIRAWNMHRRGRKADKLQIGATFPKAI